jgi:hypothetical protein
MGLRIDTKELDAAHRQAAAAVRERAGATHLAAAEAATAAFDDACARLTRAQGEVVAKEIELVGRTFYTFVDGWPQPWFVDPDPALAECPQCTDSCAFAYLVHPAGGSMPGLSYVVCARCGEMTSGSAQFPADVTISMPAEQMRGTPIPITVTIASHAAHDLAVTVGVAFRRQDDLLCRLSQTDTVTLTPARSRSFSYTADSDPQWTVPDLHNIKVLVAADGAVRCLTRNIWMRVRPHAGEPA